MIEGVGQKQFFYLCVLLRYNIMPLRHRSVMADRCAKRACNFFGVAGSRLLHKLLGYLSKVAPKIFKSCPKVAYFTRKLLKSCFLSTQKNQFLQLMKVNLCTSIPIIYLFIYSFLLANISIPTEILRLF